MPNTPFSIVRQQYPDPFLDIASTKLPKSRRKLIEMQQLFALTHPQIAPIVKKLARYAITRLIINAKQSGHTELEKKWKTALEDDVDIYRHAEEAGLDYYGTGNAFITVHKPFVRSYECDQCGVDSPASAVKYYIRAKKFHGKCPACKKAVVFKGKDRLVKNIKEVSIVRVPPQDMYIRPNPLTGKNEYYRNVPKVLKKAVTKSKPDRYYIDHTPWAYVQAALHNKKIKFGPSKLLHLKEPTISSKDFGWGMPITLAGLKDAYLNQIYKKADETVANERTVPARFVFPQGTSQDPLRTISLSKFANFMSRSIKKFRYDKNAIMPVPFPIGVAELGGDAQRLFTAQLRELTIKEIIGSTGMPEGFLSDGMTWSGGSVQLRMLENSMMPYMRALNQFLRFVVREVSKITEWPEVDVKFKPFRMQDDVQMMQIIMQLAQMKHVSFKEVLDRLDLDWEDQHERVREETGKVQDIQVQESLLQAKSALASVQWQMASQNRQSSYEEMMQEIHKDNDATFQHLTRSNHVDQAEEEIDQQQQEAAQQPDPEQERMEAQTEQLRADATETKLRSEGLVQNLVTKLQSLDPKTRETKLEALRQNAPDIAEQVEDALAGSGDDIEQLVTQMSMNSKDIKDLANKILMLPPDKKSPVFETLMRQDPQKGMLVAQQLNGMLGGGGGQEMGSAVDMRQLPQAKPPRRNNK